MARLTQADLTDLNTTFEERTPEELLTWTFDVFKSRVAAISAMQEAGTVICHMLSSAGLKIKVYFVDTGVMFQETLETRDRISREYGLEVVTVYPKLTMEEQTAKHGVLYLSPEGQGECCTMRKVEPLSQITAAGQFDALIGGLRRSDGGKRESCPILAVDPPTNTLRVNPLATFNDEQLHEYILKHSVITNPLHQQGYPTVGCNRCTTPVLPNEPKRAGRWRHLGPWAIYCGINPTDRDGGTSSYVDLPQSLVDRILGRETDFMI